MNASAALKASYDLADMLVGMYLGDLTDEQMLIRPCEGANHIKWQLGHLLTSQQQMVNTCVPGAAPELPAGFAERYTKETATVDDPAKFDSKETYLSLLQQQKDGLHKALASLSDADLDKETGVDYARTVGDMMALQGIHWTMHSGQWVVIRRQLGKPALM